jgi:RNA polymerase sigma-70 factor (ECF subfamily)
MGAGTSREDINAYANRVIRNKARQLVGKSGLNKSHVQDLEQEMRIDLFERMPKFDGSRASCRTFIVRIVNHKASKIMRSQWADKRHFKRNECSLNELVDDGDGFKVQRSETIDQDEYVRRTAGGATMPAAERRDLAVDLEGAAEDLPRDIRAVFDRLKTQTIAEVAAETGISRTSVMRIIYVLREHLARAGLEKYLQ